MWCWSVNTARSVQCHDALTPSPSSTQGHGIHGGPASGGAVVCYNGRITQVTDMTQAPVGFRRWITKIMRTHYGTWRQLAIALHMTESGLMRGVARGSLDLVNLLRLAELTDTPPLDLVRLANKTDLADLLERRFGTGATALSGGAYQLLAHWGELDPDDQRVVMQTVEYLVVLRRAARAQLRDRSTPAKVPHNKTRSG